MPVGVDKHIVYHQPPQARARMTTLKKAPSIACLNNLPWDIWLNVADLLELSDCAALSLVCRRFALLLRKCWSQLNRNRHQRLLFLQRLDNLLPGHRFCSACTKYHRRNAKEERSWLRSRSRTACGERNIPLGHDTYLHWPSIQLALRAHHHDNIAYGLALDDLPTQLDNCIDEVEDLTWRRRLSHSFDSGHLILTLDHSRRFQSDLKRLSHFSRGYLLDIGQDLDSRGSSTSVLHARQFIDAGPVDSWVHPDTLGWSPWHNYPHPLYFWSTAHWDPRAGLPGLHWTELSAARRSQGIPEWSNWRYDNKTGLPIDPKTPPGYRVTKLPLLIK